MQASDLAAAVAVVLFVGTLWVWIAIIGSV